MLRRQLGRRCIATEGRVSKRGLRWKSECDPFGICMRLSVVLESCHPFGMMDPNPEGRVLTVAAWRHVSKQVT